MKKIFQTLLLLIIISSPASSFDEERYTGGGQWPVSSSDDTFIHYQDQNQLTNKNEKDEIEGRFFYDQEDVTDDYQVHAIYILASDSKDKKYDTNGTIESIVIKGNEHLKKISTKNNLGLDLTKDGNLDVSFLRVNKTRKEINRLENAAGYFTGMAILHGFNNPKNFIQSFIKTSIKENGASRRCAI